MSIGRARFLLGKTGAVAWAIGSAFNLAIAPLGRAADVGPTMPTNEQSTLVLVVGAAGEPEYARDFQAQVDAWTAVAARAGARRVLIGATEKTPAQADDRTELQRVLGTETTHGAAELWLVLIGHGTFDSKEAKFNLRGPDVTAQELAGWLKPCTRPLVVIDTSAASAPFLAALAGKNRAVVSATRSGFEQNVTRFGKFLAEAMGAPASDLDKDGQVSLLEAFLMAARQTNEFYKTAGRVATEHALLDDNGDGLGTPADWFRGVRAIKRAADGASLDGARARQFTLVRSAAEQQLSNAQRARRDELELAVERLREEKSKLPETEYYRRLEQLMLELAAVYDGT